MKPFAWSWSKLKNYRSCPKRHWHVDIAKDFAEAESEQLKWGDLVHKSMAARIDKGTPLPLTLQHYEDWPARIASLKTSGHQILVENKLAMTSAFTPTEFFDNATWFRGVVDVLAIAPAGNAAFSFDWKTGKVDPDFEQLALSAQLIFAHYPKVELVGTAYVWLGNDDQTVNTYARSSMIALWNNLWPEIKAMAEAHRTTTYPPKPSGLCRKYCPVTSCPYHGRGG